MYLKKATYQVMDVPIPITGSRFSLLSVVSVLVGERIAAFILFKNNKDFII